MEEFFNLDIVSTRNFSPKFVFFTVKSSKKILHKRARYCTGVM